MAQWIRLCSAAQMPANGGVGEFDATGVAVCVANSNGLLAAVDNACPHRGGPLSEGWLEDGKIVCPWHAWGFDLKTGACPEERSQVKVYPLQLQGEDVLIDIA